MDSSKSIQGTDSDIKSSNRLSLPPKYTIAGSSLTMQITGVNSDTLTILPNGIYRPQ